MDAVRKRGRQAGTLVRSKCKICSKVELSKGGGKHFRCESCKGLGFRHPSACRESITGRAAAQSTVAALIRSGSLSHPTNFQCVDCSCPATEYEHRNYNKPEQVEPICRSCNLKRGPAIPLLGSFEKIISMGRIPYVLRCRVKKLLEFVGLPTEILTTMPKRLDMSHWEQIMFIWTDPDLERRAAPKEGTTHD